MAIVAGVDSSTQSCTVELRDAETGTLLGAGRAPHPPTVPPVSEQDPRAWWAALEDALARALASAGLTADAIDAMSVAGQCHGLVLLDAAGEVLRPAKLWNDTTSSPQARAMVEALGPAAWAEMVGSVPTAAFTITKLAWVAQNEPAVLSAARTVLLPHDYLTWRLSGQVVTDRSEASGTGYYAAHHGRWLTELLEDLVDPRVDWSAALPRVLGPSEAVGPAMGSGARELGLREDAVVGPGAGDQHAGALGIGLGPREVLYSLGTSGVVMTTSPTPVHDPTGWVDGVADAAGGYLPLVCTLNATKVTDLFARLLGVDHDGLAELALAAPQADDRPVLSAFCDGERTPDRPLATGVLAGLHSDTSREEIALAAFEGVVLGLARGHEAIRRAGAAADGEVVVTGGGARSPAYRQVLADALGCPVQVRAVGEATARGAAIQAAAVQAGGGVREIRDAWRPSTTAVVEPRSSLGHAVRERYLSAAEWTGADRRAGRD